MQKRNVVWAWNAMRANKLITFFVEQKKKKGKLN